MRHILSDALAADCETRTDLAEASQRRFTPFDGVDLEPPSHVEIVSLPTFEG